MSKYLDFFYYSNFDNVIDPGDLFYQNDNNNKNNDNGNDKNREYH